MLESEFGGETDRECGDEFMFFQRAQKMQRGTLICRDAQCHVERFYIFVEGAQLVARTVQSDVRIGRNESCGHFIK